jgi:hypothetical protein
VVSQGQNFDETSILSQFGDTHSDDGAITGLLVSPWLLAPTGGLITGL